MSRELFAELERSIEHKVRGLVEDHPLTCHLPEVALRNMAYCAAGSAISALTDAEVALVLQSYFNDRSGK